eukprot:403375663
MESVTIDPKSNQANGMILVKCDKPYYYPGDTVIAEVLFRPNKTIDVRKFEMELRGSEVYSKVVSVSNEKDKEFTLEKQKFRIMNSDVVMTANQRVYEPGDYKIILETDLSEQLPASFFCPAIHKDRLWPVQITYEIRADMEGPDGKKLFLYKCPITIRQKNHLYLTIDSPQVKTLEIKNKNCLRFKQGHLSLSVLYPEFAKNIEQGKVIVNLTVDNSKGCANIQEIRAYLTSGVYGHANYVNNNRADITLYLPGLAAKSKEQRTLEFDMNMSISGAFGNHVAEYEKKKKLSIEQKFLCGKRNFGNTQGKTIQSSQSLSFMVIYQKKCWTEYELQHFHFNCHLPQAVNPERMKYGMPLDFQEPIYLGKFYPAGTLAQREAKAKLNSENPSDQTNTTLI